ncbi:MAG: CPBP family intramembrane metalloprotease [Bacteroidetes bacterium]|nr:CPBP family intramembrane metalloprotease [Bacteroidota bacterium]
MPEETIAMPLPSRPDNAQNLTSTFLLSLLIFFIFITSQGILFFYFLIQELKKQGLGISESIEKGEFAPFVLENIYNGNILIPTSLYSNLICIGFVFLILKLKSITHYLDLNIPKLKPSLFWIGLAGIYAISFEVISIYFDVFKSDFALQITNSTDSKLMLFLAVGLFAPIFEEVFFRGFLFKSIENSRFGPNGAVIITSVLFVIIHTQYNFYIMAALLPLALILAFAKLKTKSLFIPIIIHVLNNTLSLIFPS